jgi:hypothetical protein
VPLNEINEAKTSAPKSPLLIERPGFGKEILLHAALLRLLEAAFFYVAFP